MTTQEQQHVIDVIRFFYPEQQPPDPVTEEVAAVTAEMLHEALKASKAMDFVPRPAGFKPGVVWLVSQAVQMAWRTRGKQRIYESVRRTVAWTYRSRFELAKVGL